MEYQPLVPDRPPLAGAVESIFHLSHYKPEHKAERIVPNGRVSLIVELDNTERHIYDDDGNIIQTCIGSWLSGIHSRYLLIGDTTKETTLMATIFNPGKAHAFLGRDLSEFNDRVVSGTSVFGNSISQLRSELLRLSSPVERLQKVSDWLISRFHKDMQAPAIVDEVVGKLVAAPGAVRLTEAVDQAGSVSYKHFVQLFKQHVGPTPKRMQRILRFSQVFESLQGKEEVDWPAVSAELGYADQAHFIRDFSAFSGYTPERFRQKQSDRINFFPE